MRYSDQQGNSNTVSAVFEKRKEPAETVSYPLVDSDGNKVEIDRRIDASVYLESIEIEDVYLHDKEFKQLFSK